jgi:hypothetical protein
VKLLFGKVVRGYTSKHMGGLRSSHFFNPIKIKVMKKLLIVLSLGLTGCLNEPQSIEHTGKDDKFQVEYLFEKDGVKVYRFYDGGYSHYFTTGGETTTWQQSGKTSYEERIAPKQKSEYEDVK